MESILESAELMLQDNASEDTSASLLTAFAEAHSNVRAECLSDNLGFSKAHNLAARAFLSSESEFFVVVNPDLKVLPNCFENLAAAAGQRAEFDIFQPVLLRAGLDMQPDGRFDSLGIELDMSFRHFDRESNEPLRELRVNEEIFGATGAFTFFRRSAVEALMHSHEGELYNVDFFAYREDAELAFRAQFLGLRSMLVKDAQALHVRQVLPETRNSQSDFVNCLGVQNRFLLQFLHFDFRYPARLFLQGLIFRNILVLLAVLTVERTSLRGVLSAFRKLPACLERRADLRKRAKKSASEVGAWFGGGAKVLEEKRGND